MTKTQITVPDELYKQAKAIAEAKEWSLAEVFRRGLEYMASVHKPILPGKWELPVVALGDNAPSTAAALEALAREEEDGYLLDKINHKR